jgi:DNA gyrase subunit B
VLDREHNLYGFSVESVVHGFRRVTVGAGLVQSPEFRQLLPLQQSLKPFDHPPFTIKDGGRRTQIATREELLSTMMGEAKHGMSIQRYKGLGEMNPEQLWDTTMNPVNRRLFQVRLQEAEEAEHMFTVLMGEQVEPRREFIVKHALEVQNLDI